VKRDASQTAAKVAALLLLAVILAAGAFIVSHVQHAHIDDDCPICHQVTACGAALAGIGFAAAGLAFSLRGVKRPSWAGFAAPGPAMDLGAPRRTPLFSDHARLNN
jgi:hypothetical protein